MIQKKKIDSFDSYNEYIDTHEWLQSGNGMRHLIDLYNIKGGDSKSPGPFPLSLQYLDDNIFGINSVIKFE